MVDIHMEQDEPCLVCTCCHHHFLYKYMVRFHEFKYNFDTVIVKKALTLQYRIQIGLIEYICRSCHDKLRAHTTGQVRMPKHSIAMILSGRNTPVGVRFCKKCKDEPIYVCTYCHRMLFKNSVKIQGRTL